MPRNFLEKYYYLISEIYKLDRVQCNIEFVQVLQNDFFSCMRDYYGLDIDMGGGHNGLDLYGFYHLKQSIIAHFVPYDFPLIHIYYRQRP